MSDLIQLQDISKNFGPVRALSSVQLSLQAGEILALVGENGAGKSTLMKILGGVYPFGEYEGSIKIGGKLVRFESTKDSEKNGISLIHQELSTFPHLTVAENLMVGHWPHRFGIIDRKKIYEVANQALAPLGADFNSRQIMATLSVGQQQLVEIAKALSRKSKILILDEPTSSLSGRESEKLFKILRELRSRGCGLIYISHRMEEIFSLADRVSVLRDGQSVFTSSTKEVDANIVIRHMVGRKLENFYPESLTKTKESMTVLQVKQFSAQHKISNRVYGPVNFTLAKGEILGFGGLLGSGRSELLQALCGDEIFETHGEVILEKKILKPKSLRKSFHFGFGLVPEDRKTQSILPSRTLNENAGLLRLSQKPSYKWVASADEVQRTQNDLKVLNTKFNLVSQKITELSGGNQQKVIFARILQNNPHVLILDEPTRGVDVGAKYEIYQLMREWAKQGKSILLISSDLPELMAMSDRLLVMGDGKIRGELQHADFNQERIMQWALERDATSTEKEFNR